MNCTPPTLYDALGLTHESPVLPTLAQPSPSEIALSLNGTRRSSVRLLQIKSGSTVRERSPRSIQEHRLILLDLSLEFLMGRALDNAMLNVGLKSAAKGASTIRLYRS